MTETETPEALLNDVVLGNIFKYLGYKDLRSCRETGNKIWLRNSKKAWSAQTKVVLVQNEGESNPILKYLNQTEIHSNATNYKLDGIQGKYFGLWERFGPSIKELELSSCKFGSSDQFRLLIYTQCPNLEKLVASEIILETQTDIVEPKEWEEPQFGQQNHLKYINIFAPRMPTSWMDLLSRFPNLQFLKAAVYNINLFKTISMIRQHDPEMLNLKHIEIENVSLQSDYDESIRWVFLDPEFNLETMRMDVGNCQPETLLDILDLHAKSLKKLILEGDGVRHPILRYPRQPLLALEELEVHFCIFSADIFRFTPNLRKVYIDLYKPSSYNILERVESNVKVNSCMELRLYAVDEWGDMPESDFLFFLRAFPNVESLDTRELNNRKFSLICEHLTKLVAFSSHTSAVDVTGLLGYDPDSEGDSGARNPNITDLKDLQSFSMVQGFETRIEMKNGGKVFEELKKLHFLKKFELKNYKFQGDEQVWENIFAEYSG